MKCANCGKEIRGEPVFEKGKFFDSKPCLDSFHKKVHSAKPSKKKVCEFC